MSRKRIGLLVGEPDEIYQKKFIEGFLVQTFSFNYDVCIFAMYKKYQATTSREVGESNIFSLIPYDALDGIVVLADTIQTTGLLERLENELHSYYGGPVLFVDKESKYFPSIATDHYHSAKRLVSHLIEHHGLKRIAYLTGKSWHPHSVARLKAYRDSMEEHGLPIREDWIYEGDFWYTSGESMVDKLLKNREDLPDAIACANDYMAIGVAGALEKNGIRVPEDIAVVGYDSSEEGKNSPKPLTSATIPSVACGKHAGTYIHALLNGEYIPDFKTNVELFIGSSCGCSGGEKKPEQTNGNGWEVVMSERNLLSDMNAMMDDLMCQNKLTALMNVIFSYTYQIQGFDGFHLCLNSQWQDMDHLCGQEADWENYSEQMLYVIECRASVDNPGRVDMDRVFDKKDLLPELAKERTAPKAFFFTPMYFEERCMGYAVMEYQKADRLFDSTYFAWLSNVMRGLESFRRLAVATRKDAVLEQVQEATSRIADYNTIRNHPTDELLGSLHTAEIAESLLGTDELQKMDEENRQEIELVERILNQNLFTYHFQPIVDARTGDIYSYEALMRAETEQKISPLTILKHAKNMGRLYEVEKYTLLNVLHFITDNENFFEGKKVFINSIPGMTLNDEDMKEVTELVKKNQGKIVIELTELAELEDDTLAELKERYAQMGMETAVDDYGTGYSNIANLLRYMPRYVKIDRMLLTEIQNSPQKQHLVKEIIEFSHENDIVVLAEGVETSEELQTVIYMGADLIQGYYTARPNAVVLQSIDINVKREIHQFVKQLMMDKGKKVYTAGKEFRISLAKLLSDEYEYIVVPNEETTYRDLNIIGVPGMNSHINIQVADGYRGRLVLNNVCLGGKRGMPCIDVGEDCDLTLDLRGENKLQTGGIRVPQNTLLTIEGEGSLDITCNYDGCFAIGNDMDKEHGLLNFDQDGTIEINVNTKNGVAVGSGLGGKIQINRGKYIIHMTGDNGVCIGSIEGPADVSLLSSDITIEAALYEGVGIGSVSGDVTCNIKHVSFSQKLDGVTCVGIGSLSGDNNTLVLHNSNARVSMNGTKFCGIGSLESQADIDIRHASYSLEASGDEIIVLGDFTRKSHLTLQNSEVKGKFLTKGEDIMGLEKDQIYNENGRFFFRKNGEDFSY